MRRVCLFFGVAGIVGAAATALVPGCTTRECSLSTYTYTGGRMVTPNEYETNDWNERWIPYPGDVTVHVQFPPGVRRQPIAITGYVGTSDTPNGGVDFEAGTDTWTIASGQLVEAFAVSDTGFSVTNNSCANYSARFVVDFAPATFTLFGGVGSGAGGALETLGDTWTWDGSQWLQAVIVSDAMAGPTARSGASFVTLASSQYFFGGVEAGGTYDSDLWRWDGVTWTQVAPCTPLDAGGECAPPPRAYAAVAALPNQPSSDGGTVDKIVVFGGRSASLGAGERQLVAQSDTWTFDGTTWTPTIPRTGSPPARWGATAFTFNGKVVLFGGMSASLTPLGDTWIWDDQAQTWTQVLVGATAPSARAWASQAPYGAVTGPDVVLFGGTDGQQDFDDTWTWDGASWSQVAVPGPGARSSAAMGTLGESVLLFGGIRAGTPLGDFWSWNGSAWQLLPQLPGASFPSPRAGAGAGGI